jgi:hypothetical protein
LTDPWLIQFEALRKEREEADRSFKILGETLTVKASVAPEIGFRLGEFQAKLVAYQAADKERETRGEPPSEMGVTNAEFVELSEWTIRSCLEPDSVAAWERLRAPDAKDPLTLLDIYAVATYVQARASGLPTVGPADSSAGPQTNGTSSTAASPSPAAPRRRSRSGTT